MEKFQQKSHTIEKTCKEIKVNILHTTAECVVLYGGKMKPLTEKLRSKTNTVELFKMMSSGENGE